MQPKNVIIMGAAGRDFHNFNMYFRKKKFYRVVAFTAAQIPDIAGRKYPAKLAGRLYPKGILIHDEKHLPQLIKKFSVKTVYLSYSDLAHIDVMHKASIVLANGASFVLLGPEETTLRSSKPVIAVCAVRTGAGKSPTTRKIASILKEKGYRVVAIRHPMPYGDLVKQEVQRFGSYEDLRKQKCTIEEREEYEPLIKRGIVVYAGVDYEKIVRQAEKEADVIIFDGGNNDFPFIRPDLQIVVVDPLRAGHEISYHPGEVNLRSSDVVLINKMDSATREQIETVQKNIGLYNPKAAVIRAMSRIMINRADLIKGKRVAVVEDGPTVTHGGMSFGAGTVAARLFKAKIIDASKYAVGSMKNVYKTYPHLNNILPSMGYSKKQMKELEMTLNRAKCDAIIDATPVDISKLLKLNKPVAEVEYEVEEIGKPDLLSIINGFEKRFLR